jgi:ATP-dependent DNA helicase RecG
MRYWPTRVDAKCQARPQPRRRPRLLLAYHPVKAWAWELRLQDEIGLHPPTSVELDGRAVLVVQVPKAARAQRPVYVNGSWERGTYLRVHEGDRVADREVARRMLADAVPNRDAEPLDGYERADLHGESVRRYRELFAAKRQGHPFLEQDEDGFLTSVGALVRGRGGDARPSLAGLLMLGNELVLRQLFPNWHLSYREPPDDPADARRWVDRLHPDGTWNANLFQFYLRAILKLHDGLKVPFALEAGQFRVDETPVHAALREALVNTLIHADYQGTTGVRVIRTRTSFEFIDPGLLLVSPEQVWRGGISEARNPGLQRLFGFVQLGEREGSGGPAMRRVWRDQHWRAPRLWEDVEHGEVHLELRQESLLPEAAVTSLVARFGESFVSLDELARVILVTAEAERSLSHGRVRELSDAHPRDITTKLRELVRRGFLESEGRTRGVTYSVAAPLSASTSGSSASTSGPSASTSGPSASTSSLPLPPRASHEAVREAIIHACTDGFLTVEEIAAKVGRAGSTLRIRFLPDLVRGGLLLLRFPETPNHPAQAYQSAKDPTQ